MKISAINSINFKRKLKPSEEAEYASTLKQGKSKAAHAENGKSILIVPAASLPQSASNNTGVGNLASDDAQKFFDFSKKYWGINEVQILPIGQYHSHAGEYIPYGGTSMDLGNHVINLQDYLTLEEFNDLVKNNPIKDRVNFPSTIEANSMPEELIKKVYALSSPIRMEEFDAYKKEASPILERKGLFRALAEINHTHDYKKWNDIDRNLFNEDIVSLKDREKRIEEIKKLKSDSIELFKFKQFLADKSLQKAKTELNKKEIKLSGDIPCHFAYEEVWAHPKAFLQNTKMDKWGFAVLDKDSPEAEQILREKVNFYAKRFDGFRVDAAWTYVTPSIVNSKTGQKSKLDNGTFFLNIIDDEVKKVKGESYDLNNIMHEFAASSKDFDIHSEGVLKPLVRDRVKIYTSDHMSESWGSAHNFIKRNWSEDKFIIGATNHDSPNMKPTEKQIKALSEILNIPKEQLNNKAEFIKAKLAEPLRAKNNMLFFLPALGYDNEFQHLEDKSLNWSKKVPENYEEVYFNALAKGEGFNPMDALEKQFKAQGLDKTEPELFKKIVKYKKILAQKEGAAPWKKYAIGAACIGLVLIGLYLICRKKNYQSK